MNLKDYPYSMPEEKIISIHNISGNPIPQSRPRFGRGGRVFSLRRNVQYRKNLGIEMLKSLTEENKKHYQSFFGLRVFFYRETKQRCDIDNLLKAVQDAGTGILWKDDSQIHEVFGRLVYDKINPRIEVLIYKTEPIGEVASWIDVKCKQCNNTFNVYRSGTKGRSYCSRECSSKAHHVILKCNNCSKEFSARTSTSKIIRGFCSRSCGISFWQKNRPDSSRNWLCKSCGKNVSRKEYTRCMSCLIKSRNGKWKTTGDIVPSMP